MKLSQITIIEAAEVDFAGVDPDIVDRLSPFPSHLQQWAVTEIKKGEHAPSVVDAVEYYQKYIKDNRFQAILGQITPTPKNILTLSLSQVKDAQAENDEKYHQVSKRQLKKARKLNYTDKLVDTPKLTIIKVTKKDETDGAAKILSDLSRASKWCVTNVEKAEEYLSKGPLYVIYLDGEKYLCAPGYELMDVTNDDWELNNKEFDMLFPYIPNIFPFLKNKKHPAYKKHVVEQNDAYLAFDYAKDVIKGRCPEVEPIILQDPSFAYNYAKDVIKGRWPEAEPIILQQPYTACLYALLVIKGRWPEAEPIINQDGMAKPHYWHNVKRLNLK